MYQIGDIVVYGKFGVCKINCIGPINLESADDKKMFYTLVPQFLKGSIIYIPVDNVKEKMRNILTRDEAEKLMDDIPTIEIPTLVNSKEWEDELKEMARKCDCREWIKIIKILQVRKMNRTADGKRDTVCDEKYLHMAKDNLFGELSICLQLSKEKIEKVILEKINQV